MFAILALLIGALSIIINPITNSDDAHAIFDTEVPDDTPTISINLDGSGGGTVNDPINLRKEATVGETAVVSTNLNVTYSNISEYYLSVSTENGNGGRLVNSNVPGFQIGGVGTDVAAANFKDNTWGYALDSGNYNTVPEISQPMIANKITVDENGTEDNHTLNFAVKFGNSAPSGDYKSDVYVSVTMNAGDVIGLHNISTMQEITSDICSNSYEHESKQLIDIRDNNTYWVTKLKDGNCWMTQNLAYDGGGDRAKLSNWSSSYTTAQYNSEVKNFYYVGGSPKFDWLVSTAGANPNGSCATTTDPNSCVATGQLATSTPSINNSTSLGEHYKIGNYYSWEAAQNVCPASWKLPSSHNTSTDGSFAKLFTSYGFISGSSSNGPRTITDDTGVTYSSYSNPFYFTYGGLVINGDSVKGLFGIGNSGRYWTTSPYGATTSYTFLHASNVQPYDHNQRESGFSVRCVFVPTK